MTLVTYASLLILLVTVGWSIVLLVRLSDPRLRALIALLSAVALSRIAVLFDATGSLNLAPSRPFDDIPALGVSVLAVLVLALLDPAAYPAAFPTCDAALADVNADGSADGADIAVFVDMLLSP